MARRKADFDDEDAVLREVARELDIPVDDLKIDASGRGLSSFGTDTFYYVQTIGGRKGWVVARDDDAAEEVAIAVVKQDLESEPEIFNQSFIESHIDVDRLRRDLQSDLYEQAYERANEEAQSDPERFLKMQSIDWPVPSDAAVRDYANGAAGSEPYTSMSVRDVIEKIRDMEPEDQWLEIGETPEVPDSDIEKVAEEDAEAALRNPVAYLQDVYGQQEGIKQAISIAGIDEDAAAKDAVGTDGWQHFVASYDGNSYETPSGFVYWRTD